MTVKDQNSWGSFLFPNNNLLTNKNQQWKSTKLLPRLKIKLQVHCNVNPTKIIA